MVLWKLRYSGRLFTGGILAYEKHTWCWSGYFKFTLSKTRLFTCVAMQLMLSSVAVRGRIWHAAHALARDKSVLSSLWRKNQVDYDGGPRRSGHTLFFRPLNGQAHFLKSGRKNGTHFCVSMGGSRGTTNKKNKKQKTKLNKKNKNNNKNKTKKTNRTRKTMRTRRTRSKTRTRTTTRTKNTKKIIKSRAKRKTQPQKQN